MVNIITKTVIPLLIIFAISLNFYSHKKIDTMGINPTNYNIHTDLEQNDYSDKHDDHDHADD